MGSGSLSEAIRLAVASRIAEVHTSMPGIVREFTAGPPATARVELGVDGHRWTSDLERERYSFPQIVNAPIQYPGAGGYSLTWPLAVGDEVLVLFAERSLVEWLNNGGAGNEPKIARRHSLADAVVIPGLRSRANDVAAASHDAAGLVLSVPGGASIILGAGATKAVNRTGDNVEAGAALAAFTTQTIAAIAALGAGTPVTPPTPITVTQVVGVTGAGSSVVKATD